LSAIFGNAAAGNIFGSPALPVSFSLKTLRQYVVIAKQNVAGDGSNGPFDSMLNFSIRLLARVLMVNEESGSNPENSLAESHFAEECLCELFSILLLLLGVKYLLDNHIWSRLKPGYNSENAIKLLREDCKIILQRFNSNVEKSPSFKSISVWSAYASLETLVATSIFDKTTDIYPSDLFNPAVKVIEFFRLISFAANFLIVQIYERILTSLSDGLDKQDTEFSDKIEQPIVPRRHFAFLTTGSEALWSYFKLHIYFDFRCLARCKCSHDFERCDRFCCSSARSFKCAIIALSKLGEFVISGKLGKHKELSKKFEKEGWGLLKGNRYDNNFLCILILVFALLMKDAACLNTSPSWTASLK
jgi:hypothetical protein